MVNQALLEPPAQPVLEASLACQASPESKVTVVSPVWTVAKVNLALLVKRERKVYLAPWVPLAPL